MPQTEVFCIQNQSSTPIYALATTSHDIEKNVAELLARYVALKNKFYKDSRDRRNLSGFDVRAQRLASQILLAD